MNDIPDTGDEQARLWNGPAGRAWVETQELLDRLFEPLAAPLVEAVPEGAAARVLDVGCGTGAVTLAIARRLGAAGRCTGIDISQPMIAAARMRAERARLAAGFVEADAQVHAFETAAFDTIVSRLGVMFFADPVAAFANLRRAAKAGAVLRFVAWRGAAENPFMTTAERAAAPLLPDLPPRRPGAPGQFAFAERNRVAAILEDSGWTGIEVQPVEFACAMPESGLLPYLQRLGPVGLALAQADAPLRARVVERVRAAFEPYVQGGEVRFTAACWLVEARARSAPPAARRAVHV